MPSITDNIGEAIPMAGDFFNNNNILQNAQREEILVSSDGESIELTFWLPEKRLQEIPLLIVPNIGSNVDQYYLLAEFLVARQHPVFIVNYRGHGQSPGHIHTFRQLALDLLQVSNWIKHRTGSVPVLFADGLAALMSRSFARRYPKYLDSQILNLPETLPEVSPRRLNFSWLHLISDLTPTLPCPHFLFPKFFVEHSDQRNLRLNFKGSVRFVYEVCKQMISFRHITNRHDERTLILRYTESNLHDQITEESFQTQIMEWLAARSTSFFDISHQAMDSISQKRAYEG